MLQSDDERPLCETPTASFDATQVADHIREAARLLPAQGPLTAFAFLNTLQALEPMPFEEGLIKGGELFGCEPFLAEDRYRDKMAKGRIRPEDLAECLRSDLGARADERVGPSGTRLDLRLARLLNPVRSGPDAELQWFIAETDALSQYRSAAPADKAAQCVAETRHWAMRALRKTNGEEHPLRAALPEINDPRIERWSHDCWVKFSLQALWEVCCAGVSNHPMSVLRPRSLRPRDLLLQATGEDLDRPLHEFLIPLCAAFLDQGFARWEMPERDAGFWKSFIAMYESGRPVETWLQDLPAAVREASSRSPLDVIVESLRDLGIPPHSQKDFLTQEILALRGFASMFWQAEDRGDRMARPAPQGSLNEYVAVRLLVERVILRSMARNFLSQGETLADLRESLAAHCKADRVTTPEARAFQVFHIAQLLGWSAAALDGMSPVEWQSLLDEIEAFGSLPRRRIFHHAFERRLRVATLDAISLHNRGKRAERIENPQFQSVYCLDAREESFRRHLEEVCPQAETFAGAGFFGVAMYYKGVADAHFQALCPIVVRPQHWVTEEVVYSLAESDRRLKSARKRLASASHRFHVGSRSMTAGALVTAGVGVLASIPLVARVLFPRTTARLRKAVGSVVSPPHVTRLRLERLTETPGPEGDAIGYTVEEMANIGDRILSEIGLRNGFSRLVFLFGHGSFCLNNPHKSCYDCGACCGSAGGPNARALAEMLNDPRVRKILASRGLAIPDTTVFVGGLHNTGNDSFSFYDLDRLPRTHVPDFEAARDCLERACDRNAQERCRRFYSAPLNISPDEARRHVENRIEDLAQTRPEFGNASNALCVVGRRARTRGLFLDRRAFLQSYDPTLDDADATILGRILGAVVVVCSGINLQYFFSYIDPSGWGAGTKLPHNITSLLGVMDGAASDLRSGLPWQGVEIHEPVRCLFIIESTPDAIEKIMQRNAAVGNILRNGWVQLALLDPETARISVYHNGRYHPYAATIDQLPRATSSAGCYRGWREHCQFVQIAPE
ncbi:MAG: DUF2309 domain-containing protein [Planctomycetaceae bacterium]|nr:DUF2309 domain-containing protein [Planctomycetaceae bacterium]